MDGRCYTRTVAYVVTYLKAKEALREVILRVARDPLTNIFLNGKLIYGIIQQGTGSTRALACSGRRPRRSVESFS